MAARLSWHRISTTSSNLYTASLFTRPSACVTTACPAPPRPTFIARNFQSSRMASSSSSRTAPIAVDGIVLGMREGKALAAGDALAKYTSLDPAAQWAAARTSDAGAPGQVRVLYPSSANEAVVAAVSVTAERKPAPTTAPDRLPAAETYLRNEHLEQTRIAAAKGVRALRDIPPPASSSSDAPKTLARRAFAVDAFTSPHAAATGANLALWKLNHFKTRGMEAAMDQEYAVQGGRNIEVRPLDATNASATTKLIDEADGVKGGKTLQLSWHTGEVYAEAQNWSRELKETPANLMTPTIFCKVVTGKLQGLKNVSYEVHSEEWARAKGMGSFLSVTQGTKEPAKMLEIHYKGAGPSAPTVGLVGKGITFDTGGISIKPSANMKLMRADMGGAAACVSTLYALAKLQVPVNVVCVTPLTENMPSGHATKPGDLHRAMNGLTIDIDNTDAEGRLVLADALTYVSREFKPSVLLDVATLTGAMVTSLGDLYSGVFVEDEDLWQALKTAGEAEYDQFWRMPLDDRYLRVIDGSYADVVNRGLPAGACTAAIFLKQFVEGLENRSTGAAATVRYAHIDIAGTMEAPQNASPYQDKGRLTGRPVRALVEFCRRFAAQPLA